jgi:hypothetical protein
MSTVSNERLVVAAALEEFAMIDEAEGGNPLVIATERRAAELLRAQGGVRVPAALSQLSAIEHAIATAQDGLHDSQHWGDLWTGEYANGHESYQAWIAAEFSDMRRILSSLEASPAPVSPEAMDRAMRDGEDCNYPDCGCCFDAKCSDAPEPEPAPVSDEMTLEQKLKAFISWTKKHPANWDVGAVRVNGVFQRFMDPETDTAWMGFEAALAAKGGQ